MGYRSLRACVDDLRRTGQLVEVDHPIDAHLELAEIQRRLFAAGGPAVLLTNIRGCKFPMLANLFGTMRRVEWIFRDAIGPLTRALEVGADPGALVRNFARYAWTPLSARHAFPRRVRRGPVLANTTTIDALPQLVSWPRDGGPYVTLPQVYTEDPRRPGTGASNLGMYRVQLAGRGFRPNEEVGMHYQIHRGIAAHHQAAIELGRPLGVNVMVGGPPAMTLAAVMPLPEDLSELIMAGLLNRRRVRMIPQSEAGMPAICADADFCITGTLELDQTAIEGPFGDHLGYYSQEHEFPVMRVRRVYHRDGAIWPFTVVGRPPQEDSMFGKFIHELTGPIVPKKLPGVRAVHAVDEAGVHPLLLAIGSERYVPYERPRRVRELLTLANGLLGFGQLSLAKYLLLAAGEDDHALDVGDVPRFFCHILARADWSQDLHFQTKTTIDTLDYTGQGLNRGSKLVVAVAGPPRRELPERCHASLELPESLGFQEPRVVMPGVLVVTGPRFRSRPSRGPGDPDEWIGCFVDAFTPNDPINRWPLVVVVDDSRAAAATLREFLWVTFTKSNPATDVHGIGAFVEHKHWGCAGSLVIDARTKPHHAPELVEDEAVSRRVDELAAPGGPLHGLLGE